MRQFIVVMADGESRPVIPGALSVTEHYGLFTGLLELEDRACDIDAFPIVYPIQIDEETLVENDEQLNKWAEQQGYADYAIWWPPTRGKELP